MSVSGKIRNTSARANLMVAVGSILYFLVLVLALYVMDRQVYSGAKLEIIRDNFYEIFRPPDNLNERARSVLSAQESSREYELKELIRLFQEIVDGPSSMVSMALVDDAGKVIASAENPAKNVTMNTWQNNLFIREFSGRTSQNVSRPRVGDGQVSRLGRLTGIYTSPPDVPAIHRLTVLYRWYALIMTVAWLAAWLLIYYYLLRPVRNVTLHLDVSRGGTPSLIPGAHGALEQGYNELAASALLQQLEEILNDAARPDADGLSPARRREAIHRALALAGHGFGADALRLAILGDEGGTDHAETFEWMAPTGDNSIAEMAALSCPADMARTHVQPYGGGDGFTYHAPLAEGCLQADCVVGRVRPSSGEFQDYLARACEVMRAGLVAFQAYSEQLFKERSEANISLSRNMGHDLTNVIATSKLELMGIKRVLEGMAPGVALNEARATILGQSVSGLLESTRLMQEMVNIYRSFSYVKRPAYERRPLAPLVEEFMVTFEPALSSQVSIRREYQADIPAPIVEPRLLKLALFNVLQNALDAMKRAAGERPEPGVVTVAVRHDAAEQRYEIRVADNGPGIRDDAGKLLEAGAAQRIFDYGYTTKGESGEGLGLNWVRTILADYHDGGVLAENAAAGGAVITLWLRSMERKEARVSSNIVQKD